MPALATALQKWRGIKIHREPKSVKAFDVRLRAIGMPDCVIHHIFAVIRDYQSRDLRPRTYGEVRFCH